MNYSNKCTRISTQIYYEHCMYAFQNKVISFVALMEAQFRFKMRLISAHYPNQSSNQAVYLNNMGSANFEDTVHCTVYISHNRSSHSKLWNFPGWAIFHVSSCTRASSAHVAFLQSHMIRSLHAWDAAATLDHTERQHCVALSRVHPTSARAPAPTDHCMLLAELQLGGPFRVCVQKDFVRRKDILYRPVLWGEKFPTSSIHWVQVSCFDVDRHCTCTMIGDRAIAILCSSVLLS